MTTAEICANVIAIVALICSFISLGSDRRAERKGREFELFRDMYQTHLIQKLPEARAKISISGQGVLSGIDPIIEELNSVRKDSRYFSFSDASFYEDLKKKLWALEDFLTLTEGETGENPIVEDRRLNFEYEVDRMIGEIYKTILKRYK